MQPAVKKYNSHSTHNGACNERLNSSDDPKDNRRDPDKLPVPPLNHHRVHSSDKMDPDDIDQRPEQSKAEHGPCIVEVDRLRAADGERPVQRWELGWFVRKWTWVDHGL